MVDRVQILEDEVRRLGAVVGRLQEDVAQLRRELSLQKHPIEALLWQRGFPVLAHGDLSQILLPANASRAARGRFYELMRRYSFRLFLRELIQLPQADSVQALGRYCSLKTVRSYLQALSELHIAVLYPDGSYALLSRTVPSFGPTLEWYVCEVFQREFLAPALFNVRLKHTRTGGDYDVIASLAGHLAYVEVKSSPPRGVEVQAVYAFLNRICDLQPQVAVFLVDTELRMKDKIVPLFSESLERLGLSGEQWPVVRLQNEAFHINHGVYLINSLKGIYTNLRLCFRDFLRWRETAKLPGEAVKGKR